MMRHIQTFFSSVCLALVLTAVLSAGGSGAARADHPSWVGSAVIYCVNPEIFSTHGLKGVTAQIPRLKRLGVNVIWLMPFYARGEPTTGHPWFNSPYCIRDYESVDPRFGTLADFAALVAAAHRSGMHVIIDAVCNHTSFDNPLIRRHPEYYVHTDGNASNPDSVAHVKGLNDVAQLNFANPATRHYLTSMLSWWLTRYHIDGFRFDYADYPIGRNSDIPADFWRQLRPDLERVKYDILMLGEEEDVNLAMRPFEVDYGWNAYGYGTLSALTHRLDATTLEYQWRWPYTINVTSPPGMMHLNIQDDWDFNRDVITYGGNAQAIAASVYNLTINGAPLIYNGMEVGNSNGGVNSHAQINWNGPNARQFSTFYSQLLALRNHSRGALQQGPTIWLKNSAPGKVASYCRGTGDNMYLVEINTSAGPVQGTLAAVPPGNWKDVTPDAAPGRRLHAAPSKFALIGYDFAVYRRKL